MTFESVSAAQESPKASPRDLSDGREGPKTAQESSKTAQKGPKTAEEALERPRVGPEGQRFLRRLQTAPGRPHAKPKLAPDVPKRPPQTSKRGPRRPKRATGRPRRAPRRPTEAVKGTPEESIETQDTDVYNEFERASRLYPGDLQDDRKPASEGRTTAQEGPATASR